MNASDLDRLELALHASAAGMTYPPTPPIAAAVSARLRVAPRGLSRTRQLTWALVAVLVVLSALMLVPPARAAILEFIQIGVVRILRGPVAPPVQMPLTATPGVVQAPTALPMTELPPSPVLGLAGQMTLPQAAQKTGFPILLPAYPPDLGPPDAVYLQDQGSAMLLLVWLDAQDPSRVRMTLHEIAPGSWAVTKYHPPVIQETSVNGERAAWTEGPYMLQLSNGDYAERRLVNGHVLIWARDGITYRLESDMALEEAVKVAESLQPLGAQIPIPADLEHARHLVESLSDTGVAVLSVQHSVDGALFDSANEAAWIETDLGIADAVFFLDPTESDHIEVTSLPSSEPARYLYRIEAPAPTMLQSRTIDAAFPLYFEAGNGMFIQTSSAELAQTLRRVVGAAGPASTSP